MFCLPVPKDRFQTSKPWVFIIIALVDAVLLVPVFTADRVALFTRYAFVPPMPQPLHSCPRCFFTPDYGITSATCGFSGYSGAKWKRRWGICDLRRCT
jgi:hypothetical protein